MRPCGSQGPCNPNPTPLLPVWSQDILLWSSGQTMLKLSFLWGPRPSNTKDYTIWLPEEWLSDLQEDDHLTSRGMTIWLPGGWPSLTYRMMTLWLTGWWPSDFQRDDHLTSRGNDYLIYTRNKRMNRDTHNSLYCRKCPLIYWTIWDQKHLDVRILFVWFLLY